MLCNDQSLWKRASATNWTTCVVQFTICTTHVVQLVVIH